MALVSHSRLGNFEIVESIGAGGMGEVYRARDLRLNRMVAIKVLPREFAQNSERRERFEREARAIASLNHPNICVLHDVGAQDGIDYLVLEYLDGRSLEQLIQKGPLEAKQAIRLTIKIAVALEAAHRAGIFHRDLKPANVIVTKSGLKLVDFGLARFSSTTLSGPDHKTLTQRATAEGQILGTLPYMAPEQLEGADGDARSDIFSCGCVLYEMLTGSPAFAGNSAASIIAAIMSSEPKELTASNGSIPPHLQRILRSCLAKDPRERFQSVRDLRRALEWTLEEPSPAAAARRTLWLPWLIAAISLVALIFVIARFPLRTPPPAPVAIHFPIKEPEGAWLQRYITQQSLAISPSGARIAMIATDAQGPRIWIRHLYALAPAPLPGTEGAVTLFWSPDSRHIGFFADGKLQKITADGGAPVPICQLPMLWSATWNRQGEIVADSSPLLDHDERIRVDTGTISPRKPALWPHFLPDGKRVIYVQWDPDGLHAYLEDAASGHATRLMSTDTKAIYVPSSDGSRGGYVLFGRGSSLLAQRLDPDHAALEGPATTIAEGVSYYRPTGWSEFDASADGHLIFGSGFDAARIISLDRSGSESPVAGESRDYYADLRLDPTSSRLAADVYDPAQGGTDLWVVTPETGAAKRITFGPGASFLPVWSPDGRRIAFANDPTGTAGPQLRVLTFGEYQTPITYPPGSTEFPTDWSPDGRWIAYSTSGSAAAGDIGFASAGADHKLYPVLQHSPFDYTTPAFSPDGKYLAYSANDTGTHEIYVQAIDSGTPPHLTGEKYRVSLNGGRVPRWRPDGRELFFLSPQQDVMSVSVDFRSGSPFGVPVRLFTLPASINSMNPNGVSFEIDRSGTRFLAISRDRPSGDHLQAILHWQALLKP